MPIAKHNTSACFDIPAQSVPGKEILHAAPTTGETLRRNDAIHTERLVLRRFLPTDAEALAAYLYAVLADEWISRHNPSPGYTA